MAERKTVGYRFDPGTNLLAVHLSGIRRKMDTKGSPSILQGVRGLGVMLLP